jgi:hypothetical protein
MDIFRGGGGRRAEMVQKGQGCDEGGISVGVVVWGIGLRKEYGGAGFVIDGELWVEECVRRVDGESEVGEFRKGKCNVRGQVMRWARELVNSKQRKLGYLRSDNFGVHLSY